MKLGLSENGMLPNMVTFIYFHITNIVKSFDFDKLVNHIESTMHQKLKKHPHGPSLGSIAREAFAQKLAHV